MPAELPRCSDCGTALKSVPTWLANAKVNFTCSACPKRSNRASAAPRIERPIETKAAVIDDPDIDGADIDENDEEADLEIEAEELDDVKEDADI